MSAPAPAAFSFTLPVKRQWRNVDLLRRSVEHLVRSALRDSGAGHRAGVLAAELMANALKHGDWADGQKAEFRFRGDAEDATVELRSPVEGDAADLLAAVEEIEALDGPEGCLERLMERSSQGGRVAVGLLRVSYETRCRLRAMVEDGGFVCVRAELPLREHTEQAEAKVLPQDFEYWNAGGLELRIAEAPTGGDDSIEVVFGGVGDDRRPAGVLRPCLEALKHRAQENDQRLVYVFDEVEHLNSSTTLVLMRHVLDLAEAQVRLRIHYDGSRSWQRMVFASFHELASGDGMLQVASAGGQRKGNGA